MKYLFFFLCSIFLWIHHSYAQNWGKLVPKKGLVIESQGIKWANGSELNFFNQDKSKHHYYFTWWEQDIDSTSKSIDKLFIGSKNTAVSGTYSLTKTDHSFETTINCQWNRADSGKVDVVHSKWWIPYFEGAKFEGVNGQMNLNELNKFYGNSLKIYSAWGDFEINSSHPFALVLQSEIPVDVNHIERRDQYLLLEERNISIFPGQSIQRKFSIKELKRVEISGNNQVYNSNQFIPATNVWLPPSSSQPMILPKPLEFKWGKGSYIFPIKLDHELNEVQRKFKKILESKWKLDQNYLPQFSIQKDVLGHKEAYEIKVGENGIAIKYETEIGLQHALYSLLQVTKSVDNRLQISFLSLSDRPKTDWRGIHLFTGPTSFEFHKRQFEKILLPLKVNKVVVQCEQAEWKSFPNIHNPISISLTDLKKSFAFFRENGVEPIPLIQSLGHMEWFFKSQENRYMAVNPFYPYTLNPMLKDSRRAIENIWTEAIEILKPKTIHVGFDEIGMIGFHEPRENEITYWKKQISFLNQFTKKNELRMMIWGDMGLSPTEGPDACNGLTNERAAILRSTIPKGTFVADWHYLNNRDPKVYLPNLNIWKKNGNIPIASTWFYPDNIKGFVSAAQEVGAGVLQTTWADFESSENNMLQNIEQFGSYLLALDYAWSGRTENPENLPYNPIEKWCQLYYNNPFPIQSKNGFNILGENSPHSLKMFSWDNLQAQSFSGFSVQLQTDKILPEGTPVIEVSFHQGGIEKKILLRYGVELRAKDDFRTIFAHIEGKEKQVYYHFFEEDIFIHKLKIKSIHPFISFDLYKLHLF